MPFKTFFEIKFPDHIKVSIWFSRVHIRNLMKAHNWINKLFNWISLETPNDKHSINSNLWNSIFYSIYFLFDFLVFKNFSPQSKLNYSFWQNTEMHIDMWTWSLLSLNWMNSLRSFIMWYVRKTTFHKHRRWWCTSCLHTLCIPAGPDRARKSKRMFFGCYNTCGQFSCVDLSFLFITESEAQFYYMSLISTLILSATFSKTWLIISHNGSPCNLISTKMKLQTFPLRIVGNYAQIGEQWEDIAHESIGNAIIAHTARI